MLAKEKHRRFFMTENQFSAKSETLYNIIVVRNAFKHDKNGRFLLQYIPDISFIIGTSHFQILNI